MFVQSTNQWCN